MRQNKLSQKQLSIMSGVSEASLCRYLNGAKPRMDVVNSIATALGVSADYLLGKENTLENKDVFVETRNIVTRNKGKLTENQKAELIHLLFDTDDK